MQAVCEGLGVSERRACQVLGQYRSTQRHVAVVKSDEDALARVIDEYRRECLTIVAGRRINSHDVLYTFVDLLIQRGIPAQLRSYNGP